MILGLPMNNDWAYYKVIKGDGRGVEKRTMKTNLCTNKASGYRIPYKMNVQRQRKKWQVKREVGNAIKKGNP